MRKTFSNAHTDVSSGAGGLIFCLNFSFLPLFVYARSEGSGETAHMRRLA